MDFCLQFERFSNLAVHHGNMGVGFLFNGRELVLAHIMWQVVLGGGEGGEVGGGGGDGGGVPKHGGELAICC